jgi:hypothetical protein
MINIKVTIETTDLPEEQVSRCVMTLREKAEDVFETHLSFNPGLPKNEERLKETEIQYPGNASVLAIVDAFIEILRHP